MDSIIDLLTQGRDREAQASKIYGVVIGIVTNNKDPDKLGRVKVKFPWLDDTVESWWGRIAYPLNGKERGFFWVPEVEDEVLIAFEHGDVRFPYVVGGLYNGKDKPPQTKDIAGKFGGTEYDHGSYGTTDFNEDGKNDIRFIRSRSGHLFIMDDKSGKEKVTICDKTGKHRVEIFTDKKKVVITSEDGDIELIAGKKIITRCEVWEHHSRANSELNVDGELKVTVKKDMTYKSDLNANFKASMNVKAEAGMNWEQKAGMNMKGEAGMNLDLKAGMMFTLKGSAMGTVDGGGMLTVKGGLVMIN